MLYDSLQSIFTGNHGKKMEKYAIGIDITGSHITCQLFDLRNNSKVENSQVSMPVDNPVENVGVDSVFGIGFAMSGPFEYREGISWFDQMVDKFQSLYGININYELLEILALPQDFSIRFLHDTTCLAIGESWMDETPGYDLVALPLATVFGGAIVKSLVPIAGAYNKAEDGLFYRAPCKEAVAEAYFSTHWIVKAYQE